MLQLGLLATSLKENERRLPLHPDHFADIPDAVRPSLRFERGYGAPFHVADAAIEERFGPMGERDELLSTADVVLLPKPLAADLAGMRVGATLWGWPHCVQQQEITQIAIDRRLTLLAWEAMFLWKRGVRDLHVFERNNEMAGYAGVIHALGLAGADGHYGSAARAIVLSHGSVSRGAIHALQGRGFHDILVLTQRPPWQVHDRIPGCRYGRMRVGDGDVVFADTEEASGRPLVELLAGAEVIVNGILQDTDRPLMFLQPGEEARLRPGSLIVDVSCDLEMGFPFARPTSFESPAFDVGAVTYYAVDHTPSYLWKAATYELSRALMPYIETVVRGPEAWQADETLRRAIEIENGHIRNERILSFQHRSENYPHAATA